MTHNPPRLHRHVSERFSEMTRINVALSTNVVSKPRGTVPRGVETSFVDKAILVRAVSEKRSEEVCRQDHNTKIAWWYSETANP